MEGTRHEKVLLVVLSYVIGFTTAFIWFSDYSDYRFFKKHYAVNASQELTHDTPEDAVSNNMESVSVDESSYSESAVVGSGTRTVYENGELTLHKDNQELLLSVSVSNVELEAALAAVGKGGINSKIGTHSVSPNEKFVHFCEIVEAAADCEHYVYDIDRNVILPVSASGTHLKTSPTSPVKWSEEGLTIAQYHSNSAAEPWKLHHD